MSNKYTEVRDEYLHEPQHRRLWKESYFFEFCGPDVQGFTRLGLQPFERRANAWFYVVADGQVVWRFDQNIPIERTFGLHLGTDAFTLSYQLLEPYERWSLSVSGSCSTVSAGNPWKVLTGGDRAVDVSFDVEFSDPCHDPYPMDLLVDTDDHYEHAGRFRGDCVVDGTELTIDAMGYRDHSWGWFRDWTPGGWGHYWLGAQFDSGRCVSAMVQIRPNGDVRKTFGYRTAGTEVVPVKHISVELGDGLERDQRAREWAGGNYPDEVTFHVEFEDGHEAISCKPMSVVPLGFEDRNWALTDPDGPWLKTVYNRLPVNCEWGTETGTGWFDGVQPL